MKAIIHKFDIIKKISINGDVEIGNLPRGIGLEKIRWDGKKLINLTKLNEIHIEYINNSFRLHCIQVPFSQLVQMQYRDRKKLWSDNGVYKIKTDDQIQTELNLQYRRSHYPLVSDQMGALMKYIKTLPNLPTELQDIIDKIDNVKEVYPKALKK